MNSTFLKRVRFYHVLAFSLLLFWVGIAVYASLYDQAFDIPLSAWLRFFMIMVSVNSFVVVIILILSKLTSFISTDDYRFKTVVYFSIVMLLGLTIGMILGAAGLDTGEPLTSQFYQILAITVVIGVPVWMGNFLATLKLVEPLEKNIVVFDEHFKKRDYEWRINDPILLNDKFFRKIVDTLNQTLESALTYQSTIKHSQELISDTVSTLVTNIEEVTASAEEISASSQNIAEGASNQAQTVNEVFELLKSREGEFTKLIEQINNSMRRIDEVSIQTNILALNAGIEASRAGDYGRGFAVVAENIRKLSVQAQDMSVDIKESLGTISQMMLDFIDRLVNEIQNISAIAEETAASTEENSASAKEIAESLQELNKEAIKLQDHTQDLEKQL